jgi:uncharacterized membrane protein YgcG
VRQTPHNCLHPYTAAFLALFIWGLFSAQTLCAESFYIENYDINLSLNADASIDIIETIDVQFTAERHGIIRKIPYRYKIQALPSTTQKANLRYTSKGYNETFVKRIKIDDWEFSTEKQGDYINIRIGSEDKTISGKQRFVIRYRVINAINFFDDHSEFYYNIIGNQWDVAINKATFTLNLPQPIPLPPAQNPNFFAYTGRYGSTASDLTTQWQNNQILKGSTTRNLTPNEGISVGIWLPQNYLQATELSPETVADYFYIKKQDIQIALQATGASQIAENYTVRAISPTKICRYIEPYIHHQSPSASNILGGTNTYLVSDLKAEGSPLASTNGNYGVCIDIPANEINKDHNFTMRYTLYGNFYGSGDANNMQNYAFSLPRSEGEPVVLSQMSIKLPEGADVNQIKFNADISKSDGSQTDAVFAVNNNGTITATSGGTPLYDDAALEFDLKTPKTGFFTQSDFWLDLKLWWRNNGLLLLPLLIFGGLYRLWYSWGKDDDFTKMVQYYPPDNLCPAEAGILIDDQLHDRDLLALIPYWGAQGLIKLQAEESSSLMGLSKSTDYIFTMLKPLDIDAPAYQKTMFSGIFGSVNSVGAQVRLSSLKHKFYKKMQTAREQLEGQIKQRSFYVPNTRGASSAMLVFGTILTIAGFMFVGIASASEINSAFFSADLALGIAISGILTAIFGYFMVKKAPIGMALYQKLYGFKMFVEDAEKPKLEAFLREDPHYFDKTLPYAIVFDLTEKWTDKFKDLSVPAPEWYASNRPFMMNHFVNDMDNSMRNMGDTFTSTPPSTSGGSSFGGSGGGGFSGGGFGGGGGSSW